MEMIIAILLWMEVMMGGGQYTQAQYDQMMEQNQQVINTVLSDPNMQQQIWGISGNDVPGVLVGEGE